MTDLPPGARTALLDLFALRTVEDLGLATYVAGAAAYARHVMRLIPPWARGDEGLAGAATRDRGPVMYRTLLRGEAQPWAAGLAAGAGVPDLAGRIGKRRMPTLMTIAEAAARLGLTEKGVANAVSRGDLYPVYGNTAQGWGRARYLFAAQIRVENLIREGRVNDAAMTSWLRLRQMLPTPLRESMAGADVRPGPSPDPLPLDPAKTAAAPLAVRGLQIAEAQGWLTYHYPDGDGYRVTVGADDAPMTVPLQGLLAWLLGLADWHGRAELVAYRAELGS